MISLMIVFLLSGNKASAIPLYKVEGGGRISYLLGTDHDVAFSSIPADVIGLIKNSRVIMFEHTDNRAAAEAEAETFVKENTHANRDNRRLFTTPEWLKLRSWIKSGGVNLEYFRQASPALAMQLLMGITSERRFPFEVEALMRYRQHLQTSDDPADHERFELLRVSRAKPQDPNIVNIDAGALGFAIAQKMTIRALDRPFSTAEISWRFDDDSLRRYVKALLRLRYGADEIYQVFLNRPHSAIAMFDPGPAYRWTKWREGDAVTYVHADERINPLQLWLFNRHQDWFPAIDAEAEKGGAMIIVGRGHITGFDGVPDQAPTIIEHLKERGYHVSFAGDTCAGMLAGD